MTYMWLASTYWILPLGSFSGTHVYKMSAEGAVGELHVTVDPTLSPAQQGAGGVHHVAFNTPYADYEGWAERLQCSRSSLARTLVLQGLEQIETAIAQGVA